MTATDAEPESRKARDGNAWFHAPLIACAVAFIAVYAWVAFVRMGYAFDLEWIEGAQVDRVQRVLDGRAIYVAPSVDYVPLIYAPLYDYTCALVALVTGIGYLPLRLVSFASSLAAFALVFAIVRRCTGRWSVALVASGFLAACFHVAGDWLDLARVDSLAIALMLGGVALVERARSTREAVLAGLLLAAACFTKQTIAVVVAAVVVQSCLARRAHWRALLATTGVVLGLGWLVLDRASDGWFTFYAFELPRAHEWNAKWMRSFWTWDLARHVPIALAFAAATAVLARRSTTRASAWLVLAAVAGGLASSWLGRAHSGGFANVLLPCFATLALGFGLGLDAVERWARSSPSRARIVVALAVLASLAQFALLHYDPRPLIPTEGDASAGRALLARIAAVQGEVLVTHHGFAAARAGKLPSFHHMAAADVLRAGGPVAAELTRSIDEAIASERFAAIVLDAGPFRDEFSAQLRAHYVESTPPLAEPEVLATRVGMRTRPETWWVRR